MKALEMENPGKKRPAVWVTIKGWLKKLFGELVFISLLMALALPALHGEIAIYEAVINRDMADFFGYTAAKGMVWHSTNWSRVGGVDGLTRDARMHSWVDTPHYILSTINAFRTKGTREWNPILADYSEEENSNEPLFVFPSGGATLLIEVPSDGEEPVYCYIHFDQNQILGTVLQYDFTIHPTDDYEDDLTFGLINQREVPVQNRSGELVHKYKGEYVIEYFGEFIDTGSDFDVEDLIYKEYGLTAAEFREKILESSEIFRQDCENMLVNAQQRCAFTLVLCLLILVRGKKFFAYCKNKLKIGVETN